MGNHSVSLGGSPWQNGFIESFNAELRREQLFGEIRYAMAEAKYLADEWKDIDNHGAMASAVSVYFTYSFCNPFK